MLIDKYRNARNIYSTHNMLEPFVFFTKWSNSWWQTKSLYDITNI